MKPRASNTAKPMKPIRVRLEKDGKPYGSVTTYPAGWTPPDVGEAWEEDKKHVVVSGRPGAGDATWDEVILVIKEDLARTESAEEHS